MAYFKKCLKNKCVYFKEIILIIMKMKKRSHRYNINRPRPRHGHKYKMYEVSQNDDGSMIKQHLSNT